MSGKGGWIQCSSASPCPVCEHTSWCQVATSGLIIMCRRKADGGDKQTDRDGRDYYIHRGKWARPGGGGMGKAKGTKRGKEDKVCADDDTRTTVYEAIMANLKLSDKHRKGLKDRGLTDAAINEAGYRTMPLGGRVQVIVAVSKAAPGVDLKTVPGFYVDEVALKLGGSPGIFIPLRDDSAKMRWILTAPDDRTTGKYKPLSSTFHGGPKATYPAHVPRWRPADTTTIRLSEGALKADVATHLGGVLVIGCPGLPAGPAVPLLIALGAKRVLVAYDMDERGIAARPDAVKLLHAAGFEVLIETWDGTKAKGIDDALKLGLPTQTAPPAPDLFDKSGDTGGGRPPNPSGRPEIIISTEERDVNDEAVAALANEPSLYHRGGCLVRVVQCDSPQAHGPNRPEDAPRILSVETATLREMMSANAMWLKPSGDEGEMAVARPPTWSVSAVHARGHWDGIRRLAGVVEAPALRPDGSVLDTPGYDPATGLIYAPAAEFPPVPDAPTEDDAIAAANVLLDLVGDFPFTGDAHRAAWLASLLTVLARPAILGPCPLFLFEASTAGSGKTLLAEVNGLIITGRGLTVSELSSDNEEVRKALTAILVEGDRLVLLDNAAGSFGCPALDAVLTSTTFKGRLLGETKRTPELPVETVFYASGNNLTLRGDTHRRVIPCRLEPPCEKPEERQGFKYKNLKGHVRDNRPALVVAALTILKAHTLAGRPHAHLPALGSFEAWCEVVQRAVYWVTGYDPCAARDSILPESRGGGSNIAGVLAGWAQLPGGLLMPGDDVKGAGVTIKKALKRLAEPLVGGVDRYETLRDALAEWAEKGQPLPDNERIAYKLRGIKDRVAGGYKLLRNVTANDNKPARWYVVPTGIGGDGGIGGGSED